MRATLDEAIEDFMRFRASQNLAANTLKNDRSVLRGFLRANGNIMVNGLDTRHVVRFNEEAAKTRRASSMGPVYATLSRFFEWARHTKRMPTDSDPLFGMRRPRAVRRERQRVHRSKFPLLLELAEERSLWHRALVSTLLYTLLRESEVRDLRIRDLDLAAGTLRVRVDKSHVEDTMPISRELDTELRRWLTAYTTEVGPLLPHYYLIPARVSRATKMPNGKFGTHQFRLEPERSAGAVAKRVQPVLEGVGIDCSEGGEGGHTIRRSGARGLYDHLSEMGHPRPIRVVKDMLHHSTEAICELYLGIEGDRLDRDKVIRGNYLYGAPAEAVTTLHREA